LLSATVPRDERLRRAGGAAANDPAASAHVLDCPAVSWSPRHERSVMMNHTDGWMSGWAVGGMWVWPVIGVLVVVLLVVVIYKLSKK
jgi:hypothetical protein